MEPILKHGWVTRNMLTSGIECRTDSFIVYGTGPFGGLFRLCWAMSGKSVFDGIWQVSFVSKLLKNYSLESETDWQLWAFQ